jgi:hypothetical protein
VTVQTTDYNVIDSLTGVSVVTLNVDLFTPGALAAVPEPGFGLALGVGMLGRVGGLRLRRSFARRPCRGRMVSVGRMEFF